MDRIRIAMVGAGLAARLFSAAAEEVDEVEVAGIFSANPEHAAAFAAEHRLEAFASLEAIAADPTIQAVYVGTPNSTHYELALAMMAAGKHVLIEKPLATSAAEARELVQVATTRKVLLMEAYRAAFEPNIAVLRRACAQLRPVRRAVLIMDQYSSRFDAYKAGEVHAAFDPGRGGGSTMDLGFYPVSLAVHLFGESRTVTATGVLLPNGADAQGTILLGYDGFEVACLHSKVATMGIESQIAGGALGADLRRLRQPGQGAAAHLWLGLQPVWSPAAGDRGTGPAAQWAATGRRTARVLPAGHRR